MKKNAWKSELNVSKIIATVAERAHKKALEDMIKQGVISLTSCSYRLLVAFLCLCALGFLQYSFSYIVVYSIEQWN